MTRAYETFPVTTAAEVRAAFTYDPVHGRMLRNMSNGGLKRCGTGAPNAKKSVYVMWKRVYWPMELLVWIHGHGRWPTERILRLSGYKTHLSNLMEREAPSVEASPAAYPEPQVQGVSTPAHNTITFDFTRILSHNQPATDTEDPDYEG